MKYLFYETVTKINLIPLDQIPFYGIHTGVLCCKHVKCWNKATTITIIFIRISNKWKRETNVRFVSVYVFFSLTIGNIWIKINPLPFFIHVIRFKKFSFLFIIYVICILWIHFHISNRRKNIKFYI